MDMGDFTFPATTAAATTTEPGGPPACHLPFPKFAAAASPVWFPPSPPADDDAIVAAEEEQPRREETAVVEAGGGEAAAAAAGDELMEEEDTMDLLWEDFNEELAALGRPSPEESDTESEPAGLSSLGCAPMLRPSARVGAAGHYRRRAGSWVLLMRIFRRLFVIDKTAAVAARRHATTAAR